MIEAKIAARVDWAEGLWSIRLDARPTVFVPGQFVNIGLTIDGVYVKRSYSLASPPHLPAELFLVVVPGGALTPRLFELGLGDHLLMSPQGAGVFTLEHVPEAREAWLVCTGTGLAPYLSMMRDGEVFRRFGEIVLVHAVRHGRDLAYRDEIEGLTEQRGVRYVPVVSREDEPGCLRGRVPALIENGQLEGRAGLVLSPDRSHVLLCGNPAMIADTTAALSQRGLKKHRRRDPGHITFEKYW
jgi:ferredoxin/flavodoxin---NADP+ reductase